MGHDTPTPRVSLSFSVFVAMIDEAVVSLHGRDDDLSERYRAELYAMRSEFLTWQHDPPDVVRRSETIQRLMVALDRVRRYVNR